MFKGVFPSYPLLIMVEIILNLSFALTIFEVWAGIIMASPVWSAFDLSSITTSALPSIIWIKVSKGEIFYASASPVSIATILIFPVVFRIIVLVTTELGTYSIISIRICVFDFTISVVCMYLLYVVISLKVPEITDICFIQLKIYLT